MTPLEAMEVIAPDLAASPQAAAAIALASTQVNATHCYYDAVVANLAAHMLAMAVRQGSTGAVTSKREGDLAISFAAPSVALSDLQATSYGQEVDRLNRLCYGLSARFAFEAQPAPLDAAEQWGWLWPVL